MRLLLPAALALVLAGCIGAPQPAPEAAVAPASTPAPEPSLGEAFSFEWTGHVVTGGPTADLSHMRPYEDVVWAVQKVGFLLDLHEVPKALEVSLAWEGEGQWLIMLHSHKAEGSNAYVEHITEMSAEQPQCLRVPPEDLTPGHWQVMIHTDDTPRDADFTLTVRTWGAEGKVIDDDRHGHWPQDGGFEVDEHAILPCEGAAPAA